MATIQGSMAYPTRHEQAAYFDEWNARCRSESFENIEPESKARGATVIELLCSLHLKQPAILEIGCGTGWLTEKLLEFGDTTAIDLSEHAIDLAKQRGLRARFIVGDFYEHDFPSRHFDVVITVDTITVIPDQPLFIRKVASLMKPGAFLILTSLNKFVYERRSDVRMPRPWAEVANWLSRKELHELLKRDFRVLKSFTIIPHGNRGVLRVVNSYKLNRVLGCVFSKRLLARAKEKLGLGDHRVILARRQNH
jgi:2-polyprenyl-3-methyl-5-hydroxy-6-metoxy-1,4-benzoquinol methylase